MLEHKDVTYKSENSQFEQQANQIQYLQKKSRDYKTTLERTITIGLTRLPEEQLTR